MIKSLIKLAAARLGYTISKTKLEHDTDPAKIWGQDSFTDLAHLVTNKSDPVIFDVGAHHGHISLRFKRLFPSSHIYAFEPFPESFDQLKINTSEASNVTPFAFGFADVKGTRDFCSNTHSPANSLLETDSRGHETWGPCVLETEAHVNVAFETIDDFVRDHGIGSIDILKLDCQGAEPLIVQGAKQSLLDKVIKVIFTEILIQPTYIGQQDFHASLKMFEDLGYTLFNLYCLQVTKKGYLRQVDAIFIPKRNFL